MAGKTPHTFNLRKQPSLKELKLAAKSLNYNFVPQQQFKPSRGKAPRRSVGLEQFFGGQGSLYRLSLKPEDLKNLSSEEAAKVLQRDVHLVEPEAITSGSAPISGEVAPHHVSLMSLLGVEKKAQ